MKERREFYLETNQKPQWPHQEVFYYKCSEIVMGIPLSNLLLSISIPMIREAPAAFAPSATYSMKINLEECIKSEKKKLPTSASQS